MIAFIPTQFLPILTHSSYLKLYSANDPLSELSSLQEKEVMYNIENNSKRIENAFICTAYRYTVAEQGLLYTMAVLPICLSQFTLTLFNGQLYTAYGFTKQ